MFLNGRLNGPAPRLVASKTCVDAGYFPITDENECKLFADMLIEADYGFPNQAALDPTVATIGGSPQGCYVSKDEKHMFIGDANQGGLCSEEQKCMCKTMNVALNTDSLRFSVLVNNDDHVPGCSRSYDASFGQRFIFNAVDSGSNTKECTDDKPCLCYDERNFGMEVSVLYEPEEFVATVVEPNGIKYDGTSHPDDMQLLWCASDDTNCWLNTISYVHATTYCNPVFGVAATAPNGVTFPKAKVPDYVDQFPFCTESNGAARSRRVLGFVCPRPQQRSKLPGSLF